MRLDMEGIWLSVLPIKKEDGYGVQILLDNPKFFYRRRSKRLFTLHEMEGLTRLCEKSYAEACEVLPTITFSEPDICFHYDKYEGLTLRFKLWKNAVELSPHYIDCMIYPFELQAILTECEAIERGDSLAKPEPVVLEMEQKFMLGQDKKLSFAFHLEKVRRWDSYSWVEVSLEIHSDELCFQELSRESLEWQELYFLRSDILDFFQGKAKYDDELTFIEPEYSYFFHKQPPSMDWRYNVYDYDGAASSSFINLHLDFENVKEIQRQIHDFLEREEHSRALLVGRKNADFY